MKNVLKLSMTSILLIVLFFGNTMALQSQIVINSNDKKLIAPESISYQWYQNGKLLSEEVFRELKIQKSGEYSVVFQDTQGSLKSEKIAVEVTADKVIKIFVIGDSTAEDYSTTKFPRTGWGQVLQPFFNTDSITVVDYALGGRSSKSYLTDPEGWPVVLESLGEGDFLFIQFAHNDEKEEDTARYTIPYTTYKEYLSIYIDSARGRGAIPVLLTPVHRNYWNGAIISDTHDDYPPAMRELATEKNVPLIDLTAKTKARWEALGINYVTNNIYMNLPANTYPNYLTGNTDNTHFQEEGAYEICEMIADGIKELQNYPSIQVLERSLVGAGMIKIMPNPLLSGTITGGGVITEGKTVILKAIPKSGFVFDKWMEDTTVLSTDSEYSLIVGSSLRNLSVDFINVYSVLIAVSPYASGIVTGNGSYEVGDEVTITASATSGYQFIDWKKNNVVVSTDTTYTFTMEDATQSYIATFASITSTEEFTENQDISIITDYYNNQISINSGSVINYIQLIDLTGKVVYANKINQKSANIVLNQMDSGVFIIKIATEKYVYAKKLMLK